MTEPQNEEYVLVPKRKMKITRARKLVIGFMSLGAVAAVAGAGTFASFTASTDNSSAFTTGTLKLSNKVASGNTCFSSNVDNSNSPAADANLDDNTTQCDALLSTSIKPGGSSSTVWVTVKNEGTEDGNLILFRPTSCVAAYATPGTSEVWSITGSSSGTWTITVLGQTTSNIANGASAGAVQSALEALSTVGTGNVAVTGTGPYTVTFQGDLAGVAIGAGNVSATGTGTGASRTTPGTTLAGSNALSTGGRGLCSRVTMQIQQVTASGGNTNVTDAGCVFPYVAPGTGASCTTSAAVGTMDSTFSAASGRNLNNTMTAGTTRFYKITVSLPHQTTDVNSNSCSGGFNASGIGCDNDIMNSKANFKIRWQLNLA